MSEERLKIWRSSGQEKFLTSSSSPTSSMDLSAAYLKRFPFSYESRRFNFTQAEIRVMDPHIGLALEVTQDALDNAGLDPQNLAGSGVGVYFGKNGVDFGLDILSGLDQALDDPYTLIGNMPSSLSGRISYHYNFLGPSIFLETACSTGLVAVTLACRAIESGQVDLAVAGAVNLLVGPSSSRWLNGLGALSPDGRTRAFGAGANGFGRGEGAGAVILKDLEKAQADGDRILAVIEGTALGSDGRSAGFTAPSRLAQARVISLALKEARLRPGQVGAVEAHGTGTNLGDPIEIEGLAEVYGVNDRPAPLIVGSVKSNIGHLEAAAGMASLLKAVCVVREGVIPKSLATEELNPLIGWTKGIEVARSSRPWPSGYERRVMGVSSFGVSGSLAHVLVAEGPKSPKLMEKENNSAIVVKDLATKNASLASDLAPTPVNVYLSAMDEAGLRLRAKDVAAVLDQTELGVLARSSGQIGAEPTRLVITSRDPSQVAQDLNAFSQGQNPPSVIFGQAKTMKAALYFGQWSDEISLGQELLATFSVFRRFHERLTPNSVDWSRSILADSSIERLSPDPTLSALDQYIYQVSLAKLLIELGLKPVALVGQGRGEVAAAALAGVISLETGWEVILKMTADPADYARLGRRIQTARLAAPKIPFLSAATGDYWRPGKGWSEFEGLERSPRAQSPQWSKQSNPVAQGWGTLKSLGVERVLELGPATSLADSSGELTWLSFGERLGPDRGEEIGQELTRFLTTMGRLWVLGAPGRPNPPGPVEPVMPPRRANLEVVTPVASLTKLVSPGEEERANNDPPRQLEPAVASQAPSTTLTDVTAAVASTGVTAAAASTDVTAATASTASVVGVESPLALTLAQLQGQHFLALCKAQLALVKANPKKFL
jgi:3-oxoacyl-(acyl-carrier-protein) synthase